MHKLGFGSSSTVWIAQKTDSSRAFIAVKVTMAQDPSLTRTREIAMFEVAATKSNIPVQIQANPSDSDRHGTLTLLDYFTLHGPNGTHSVLVTDIVVTMVSLTQPRNRTPIWRKTAAHGLAQALANLHTAGIVHGDLHIANAGITPPQIAHQDPHDVMQDLSPHDITLVVPVSATHQTPSLPAYVLAPCDLAKYYRKIKGSGEGEDEDRPRVKIIDFGNAHESGTHPLHFQCAVEACAPEVAFARVVEKIDNPPLETPADVWALGTAIYEIVTRSSLFYGAGFTALPRLMAGMVGPNPSSLPPAWRSWYTSLPEPPAADISPDAWWDSRRKNDHLGCVDDTSADGLIKLLKRIFVLDPAERITAAEVVEDAWFRHG